MRIPLMFCGVYSSSGFGSVIGWVAIAIVWRLNIRALSGVGSKNLGG